MVSSSAMSRALLDGVVRAHPEPEEPLGRARRGLVGAGGPAERPGEADGVGPGHVPRLGHQHVAVAAPAVHRQQRPRAGRQPHVGDEVRQHAGGRAWARRPAAASSAAARLRPCAAGAAGAAPPEAWSVSAVSPGRAPSAKCRVPAACRRPRGLRLGRVEEPAEARPARPRRRPGRRRRCRRASAATAATPGGRGARPSARSASRSVIVNVMRAIRAHRSSPVPLPAVTIGRTRGRPTLRRPRAGHRPRRGRPGRRPAGARARGPRRRCP